MQTTQEIERGITRTRARRMVGKGWSKLINEFYRRKSKDCIVSDVKEKYGTLRIYHYGADDSDLEIEIMERSSLVCEVCGEPGETRLDLGWHKTLCNKHYALKIMDKIDP